MYIHLALLALLQASTSVISMLIQAGLAIVIPMGATWFAMKLSKVNALVNAWPDWEKRILVVVWGVIISGISHALGLSLPESWGALGAPEFQAILASLGAFLIHRLFNPKPVV